MKNIVFYFFTGPSTLYEPLFLDLLCVSKILIISSQFYVLCAVFSVFWQYRSQYTIKYSFIYNKYIQFRARTLIESNFDLFLYRIKKDIYIKYVKHTIILSTSSLPSVSAPVVLNAKTYIFILYNDDDEREPSKII